MVYSFRDRVLRAFLVPLFLVGAAQLAPAADVVEIEEHWSLSVGGPEVARTAPQVSMVMSATGDTQSDYFLLSLNHWAEPVFAPGGVQAQHWEGDDCLCIANSTATAALSHDGETIRWVQRLALSENELVFDVTDGQSESWGNFASDGALRLSTPTELTQLNAYKPAVSIEESGIGFAGNRVSSLVLERIRWRFADEEEWHEMVAPIDIASELGP